MGGLCGCCADDPPETNTMQDHKMMEEVVEVESGKYNAKARAFTFSIYLLYILY
jgi:hypothetical protein